MSDLPRHLRYWAKTSREEPSIYHPVAYHCLDVAAVGRTLLDARPSALERLARVSGMAPEAVRDLVTLLLGFHDLGKLADGFQGLVPELMVRLQGRPHSRAAYDRNLWKHDSVGYIALERQLDQDGLGGLLPADAPRRLRRAFAETWLSAAMGHHGVPPMCDQQRHRAGFARQFPATVVSDLTATVGELRQLLLPSGLSPPIDDDFPSRWRDASWLVTGLAVLADWIGSNAQWFLPHLEPRSATEYFAEVALPRAQRAVAEVRLGERLAAPPTPFADLWPGYVPTPLQRLADELPLAEGPQLVVIEEVTGGGKTEAAFTLAHRLIAAGHAEGVYVGLPTMATANAMYDRFHSVYRRLYDRTAEPSLILAHSRSNLRLALERAGQPPAAPDDETAGAECAIWLTSSRKKALLADVGIGTVDQSLLAVLQSRHQSLRLWGLAGKVLVVDEVHAADAYMQRLLAALLETHAAFGGSAVLLSATLSGRQRDALGRAFARGAGAGWAPIEDRSYPVLMHCSSDRVALHPLVARREATREIVVCLLEDAAAVDAQLAAAIEAGGCACWIRNTVADAVDAWERWSGLGPGRVLLFHARFTVDDREAIEREVLRRFGPAGGPEERGGLLVIATQVVEQSLDLDFDTLVSDLAPIDLLIQRAGRLRRHRRDETGRRIDGPDRRGEPTLHVFSPTPVGECGADWFSEFLPGAAFVYPDHGELWLGARWLAERGRLLVPDDLREVVEHVYGGEAVDEIPPALEAGTLAAEGKRRADASVAAVNAIEFEKGYCPSGGTSTWRDDVATPTRLGEPTTTVRLARLVAGEVLPWHDEGDHAWSRSEVSLRRTLVAGEWPEDEAVLERAKARMADHGRYVVVVLMREGPAGEWTGQAIDPSNRPRLVTYGALRGLAVVAAQR
jgi:CRISPR-associated endonuclease/helicase Cas3